MKKKARVKMTATRKQQLYSPQSTYTSNTYTLIRTAKAQLPLLKQALPFAPIYNQVSTATSPQLTWRY